MVDQSDDSSPQRPNFDGHPLESVPGLEGSRVAALREFGFADAEQVVAALAVPNISEHLSQKLGLSAGQMDDLVSKLQDVVPTVAAAVDVAEFQLGALAPTQEIEALGAAAEPLQVAAPLPPSVNHVAKMSAGKQQGSRGTCVAFAMTAVHEYYRRATANAQDDLSEQFLYHETKLIDGQPGICGTWNVKAAQVLNTLGECLERVWPYNPNLPCNNNGSEPGSARTDAAGRKFKTVVLAPRDVNGIKTALALGSVVGFAIPVYDSWYKSSEVARTGRITMRIGNEPIDGGHAMCLVGYQDDASSPGGGYFIVRNSWFGTWGTQCPFGSGNGTIPYGYIGNECWEAVSSPSLGLIA
jgi:C1A family cysteine protease